MARVKRGVTSHAKHKKTLKAAKEVSRRSVKAAPPRASSSAPRRPGGRRSKRSR